MPGGNCTPVFFRFLNHLREGTSMNEEVNVNFITDKGLVGGCGLAVGSMSFLV